MAKQEIWFNNLNAFVSPGNVTKIWWTKSDDANTAMNSILRFCILYSIVVCAVTHDTWPIIIPVLVAFFSYIVYANGLWPSFDEPFTSEKSAVTLPTTDNPVMNFTAADYSRPDRPPAANVLNADIKRQMSEAYNAGLPLSARDIFGRNTSERSFVTQPVTTAVNDAIGFAKWLFPPGELADWKERSIVQGFSSAQRS